MEFLTKIEYEAMESEFRSIPNDGSVSDDMAKYYCEEIAEKYLSSAFGRLVQEISKIGRRDDVVIEDFMLLCRNVGHYPRKHYLGDSDTLRGKIEEYRRKVDNLN